MKLAEGLLSSQSLKNYKHVNKDKNTECLWKRDFGSYEQNLTQGDYKNSEF